jgi:hypothetical protein
MRMDRVVTRMLGELVTYLRLAGGIDRGGGYGGRGMRR